MADSYNVYSSDYIVLYVLGGGASKENLFYAFLPIEGSPLWFAGYYMVLVLLSPVLNWLINEAPKQIVEWLLLVLFCLMVIFSTVTANLGFFAHDIWPLLFLYLTTGYIKRYKPVPESKKCLLIFGSLWFFLTFLRAYVMGKSGSDLSIYAMIRDYCEIYRARLQTLPNLLMAYSLFFYFYAIKVAPSRIINTLSGTTLGIYCFHQVPVWYSYLWTNIFQSTKYVEELHGYRRAIYTIIVIFLVWGIGTALELIRNRISKTLIEDRKYYNIVCTSIDNLINRKNNTAIEEKKKRTCKWLIIVTVLFFIIVKFTTIDYIWYIPLNTEQNLIDQGIQLEIGGDLTYQDSEIKGEAVIINKGQAIRNLSSGRYPVMLGISLVDNSGVIVNRDFLHQSIMESGLLKMNSSRCVDIRLPNMSEYIEQGYGIKLEIVQENIGWIEETAQYYWFE